MSRTKSPKKGFLEGYKTYDTSEGFGTEADWQQAFKERMGLNEAERVLAGDDPLVVLGISLRNPTWAQIKKAYRAFAMQWHPDRPNGDAERFKMGQAAYELLESKHGK